jgi:hypothetical protein
MHLNMKQRKQLTKDFKFRLVEYGKLKKILLDHIHKGHLQSVYQKGAF